MRFGLIDLLKKRRNIPSILEHYPIREVSLLCLNRLAVYVFHSEPKWHKRD